MEEGDGIAFLKMDAPAMPSHLNDTALSFLY
jgi:hypothetical protein